MKNWIISLAALLALCPATAWAQVHVVGLATDPRGEPLPGVTVRVAELPGTGAATDADGLYTLMLPDTARYTLIATMVGMRSDTVDTRTAAADSAKHRKHHPHAGRQWKGKQWLPVHFTLRPTALTMQTLVVTATRTPKTLMDVPVVTRVIDARDIKAADAQTVQDLLQSELPGIEFTYSMNQQVNLNMQGFGGNSVLFLVDGERMAGETLDNIDYSRLNMEGVGRVEVVKGAASSLYGSNAVGGVVNLISRTPDEPWSLELGSRYGTLGEWRAGGTLGLNKGRLGSVTSLHYSHADPVHLADTGDVQTLFGTRSVDVKERITVEATDRLRLTARGGYFFRDRDVSDVSHDRYRDFSGGAKADYTIGDNSDVMFSYTFDQYDKSDYAMASGLDVRDYSNVQHTLRTVANVGVGTAGTATVGGDLMRDYLMSYQFAAPGYHVQYSADAFIQWDWSITPRLSAVAAMRYDYFSRARASHLSPKVNLMYRLAKVNLRASYAGGFRAPTLKEMYMDFDMANLFTIYGNAALRPEVSDNINISAEWNHQSYNVTAMGFFNHVRNRITTVWSQAMGGMLYSNMSPLDISGVDISASARWESGWGVRMSYVFTHESLDADGLRTSATRPHSATLRVDYSRPTFHGTTRLALNGRLLSAVTCDEYTSLTDLSQTARRTYPAYMLWRFTLSHRFPHGITVGATVDNLLDYRPDHYYNNAPATPGRTYAISLTLNLEKCVKHNPK